VAGTGKAGHVVGEPACKPAQLAVGAYPQEDSCGYSVVAAIDRSLGRQGRNNDRNALEVSSEPAQNDQEKTEKGRPEMA
jgi:hypothetical protein